MSGEIGLVLPEREIAAICRRYEVRELCVFGSAARGDVRADSDIDLLVDYLPEARQDLLGLIAMKRELSDLLGRPVDVAVKAALKPFVRDGVLAGSHVVYAA